MDSGYRADAPGLAGEGGTGPEGVCSVSAPGLGGVLRFLPAACRRPGQPVAYEQVFEQVDMRLWQR